MTSLNCAKQELRHPLMEELEDALTLAKTTEPSGSQPEHPAPVKCI